MRSHSRWYLFSLAFLVFGCGHKPASKAGILRYALIEEPASLDPPLVTSMDTNEMFQNVFEGLVRYDQNMKIVPWLADRWEISKDERTYTLHLNPKARFHSPYSRQVTAADVKWSLERVLKPEMKAPLLTAIFADIEGAQAVIDGKATECSGARVIDPTTISFTTVKPCAYMLEEFGSINVFCREAVEKGGGRITAKNCIGTGPFMLKEYRSGSSVILVANPDYYRGRPKLDRIERPIVVDRQTAHVQYQRGETDLCHESFSDYQTDHASSEYRDQCRLAPLFGCSYIVMQPEVQPVFKDVRVRRAIAESIDKDEIVRVVYGGEIQKAGGFLPPGVLGHSDTIRRIPYDPAHARTLLTAAGYPGGKGFPSITLEYVTNPEAAAIAQIVRENVRRDLGLDVNTREREAGQFYGEIGRNKIAFYTVGWNAPDPHDFMTVQLHTGGRYNTVGYRNPRFDALADRGDAEFDLKKREADFRAADQIVVDDVAVIPLVYNRTPYIVSRRVHDLDFNLGGLMPLFRTYTAP